MIELYYQIYYQKMIFLFVLAGTKWGTCGAWRKACDDDDDRDDDD